MMFRAILVGSAIILSSVVPAFAQSERAEQMRRVIDGLNSADVVTRLTTLEEAVASGDKNLIRIAIQTAMASDDPILRSTAVESAFSTRKTLTLEIKSFADERYKALLDGAGEKIALQITDFEPATGDFKVHTSLSRLERVPNSNREAVVRLPGNFSGDRMSFEFEVSQINSFESCRSVMEANPGSSVLTGTLTCTQRSIGTYGVEIDILR